MRTIRYNDIMARKDMPVSKRSLHDPVSEVESAAHLTPAQRFELVWELTKTAYAFKGQPLGECGLPRHSWPVVKAQR